MPNQKDTEAAADRAFKSELNNYLDAEAEKELRAEDAERRARFMMQKGEEYDPWTFEHFEEAISNAPKFERLVMWSCLVKAVKASLNNSQENHFALAVMQEMVDAYWHSLALVKVNQLIK